MCFGVGGFLVFPAAGPGVCAIHIQASRSYDMMFLVLEVFIVRASTEKLHFVEAVWLYCSCFDLELLRRIYVTRRWTCL